MNFYVFLMTIVLAYAEGLIIAACLRDYEKNRIKPTRLTIDLGVAFGSFLSWHLKVLLGFVTVLLPFSFIYLIYGDGFWRGEDPCMTASQIIIIAVIAFVAVISGILIGYIVTKSDSANEKDHQSAVIASVATALLGFLIIALVLALVL